MTKKILIPIVLAILLAMLVSNVAFAAPIPASQGRTGRRGLGQITALGDGQFTVENRQGVEHTLRVSEDTRYRALNGDELSFGDLQVGRWVAVTVVRDESGTPTARAVILFPASFDPTQINRRARGQVTAVGGSSFTIHTQSGDDLTFSVNAGTIYAGIQSLGEMEVGMVAAVGAKEAEDGALTAVIVGARYPVIRHGGSITAVDAVASTFTLQTRQYEVLTFAVDGETEFRSRDDSVQSLADLKPDTLAIVAARQMEDGSYLAVRVGAAERPNFDLKAIGKITAISETSFTIQARNGQTYTIEITEETRFFSRDRKVHGLSDLHVGKWIGVGAKDLGGGQYQAVVVLARRK